MKALVPRETQQALRHLLHATGHWISADFAMPALVVAEMTLGGFLVAGAHPRGTLALAAIVLLAFAAWIGWLIATGATIPCGCGIRLPFLSPEEARWAALGKTVLMLIACGVVWRRIGSVHCVESKGGRS